MFINGHCFVFRHRGVGLQLAKTFPKQGFLVEHVIRLAALKKTLIVIVCGVGCTLYPVKGQKCKQMMFPTYGFKHKGVGFQLAKMFPQHRFFFNKEDY